MGTFLGVDAGGTHTRLVVTDGAGRVLARGAGGPGNLRRGGARALAAALRAARADARLDRPCDAAFLGVAGAATEEECATARELGVALGLAPAGRVQADHDLRVAQAGAFAGGAGIVVIAGTGSAAYGRDARGASVRSGVWDHAPDDPGSGYDLGRHLLAAFEHAAPGAPERAALAALLAAELPADAWQRLQDRGPLSRGEVAALAPAVLAAVDRGDLHAEGALLTGVRSLCVCVRFVHAELKGEVRDVAVVGGLAGSPTWLRAFERALARILPAARLVPPAAEPVLGAALLAAELRQS